ncbi:cell surface protein SprA [soil metagenome]
MKNLRPYTLLAFGIFSLISLVWASGADFVIPDFDIPLQALVIDTPPPELHYPFDDRNADPYNSRQSDNPLYMHDPSNVQTTIEYNPEDRQYDVNEKIGNQFFRAPSYMTFEEFKESEFNKSTNNYWKQKANEDNIVARKNAFAPKLYVGGEGFNRIFGGNTIDIRPQGSASLSFGLNISKYDNPTLPERQRKNTTFDFQEKIQMNVIGNIGEKLKISTNYNTEASFDFENQIKLEYTGYEDEIIQKIEAGNVSLPLNTTLIQGSQSLFGIKTQLKFGKLTVTTLLSQQKGKASNIEVKSGATTTTFDISADQYEGNKHYFLANYFKDNYDNALSDLPFINSQVNITRLEVWVTNKNNSTDNTRTVLALLDLAETNYFNQNFGISTGAPYGSTYPTDSTNSLYNQISAITGTRDINQVQNILSQQNNFSSSRDYDVVQNARKLAPTEYTFNPRLGYISLNQALNNNEVLGVAFEYTIGNKVYKVGDLTTSGIDPTSVLYLKMLKGRITNTKLPTWDLMMKNIYALGGFQIDKKDFRLDVMYYVDTIGNRLNYLPLLSSETNLYTKPLNRVYNLDKLNQNNDPRPDGEYDFIEGVTINSSNGRIIFPVREPFGSYLRSQFIDQAKADQFVYEVLYDSTKTVALQQPEKNKFSLKGSYISKFGSDIPLNAINIPEGSVKVTAGGAPLVENVDYTVDYNLGRVKIINQSILNSGTAINIALESNSLFSIQSKTLLGSRFDYVVNKDLVLGGTVLRLNERPITSKVNVGDEPIANTMVGVDGTWRTDSRWLTRAIDKLPGISTKEPSNITVSGEYARLIPGNSKAIGRAGTAYIDDFEGSQSTIDLTNVGSWTLASAPTSQIPGADSSTLANGFNRSKLSWYRIDPLFYNGSSGIRPSHITTNDISNELVRQITEDEIFPNKQGLNGQKVILPMFNISYYPRERGPYNFDVQPIGGISAGVAADGFLNSPASRWGGIMRRVETTDFDAANIEFIQFWLMDPFNSDKLDPGTSGGKLYFDLGNISEDILKDGKLEYENGLPADGDTTLSTNTVWGYVPKNQPPIIYAFDNNANARQYQDVGLDGLKNSNEASFYSGYLNNLSANISPSAYAQYEADPSSDNYHYYRGSDYDAQQVSILNRYKNFSQPDGNSPTDGQSPESYSTASTTLPDAEDVNKDFNQEASEQFYEYQVDIDPSQMEIGKNFIVDKITRVGWKLANGTTKDVTWYQFKIPIRDIEGTNPNIRKFGDIEGFNTISFIRMFMTGYQEPMVLRFAKLEFLRGEWRKYAYDLFTPGECLGCGSTNTTFDVSAVSLEENGNRSPIPYVIPPGIDREINVGSTNLQQINEQSLSLSVCNLEDGDARGAFKTLQLDLRSYKKLKMFVHAEASEVEDALKDGDLTAFVRVGNDFTENYYEYEIPLKVTPWGTTDPEIIWPEQNLLELDLDKFVNLKLSRNDAVRLSGGTLNITNSYSEAEGLNKITIKGNPSLSNVRTIMIGIRNPKQNPLNPGTDDGAAKCGEVWVNELRLTNFDKKGGWAATSRVTTKLADIGNLTVAGTHKTVGFGAIEQKVSERRRSDETSFNVTSSLYLGKFLPEKAALDIPMYVNYGTVVSNPQYDPLDQDVPFNTALDNAYSNSNKKEIKRRSQDYTRNKSINFTNVKKNRVGGGKPKVYDIENFNLTYGYDETFHRDINIEYDVTKTHHGALGYNYNTTPKYIAPFGKAPALKSKYLRPVKDLNINFIPTSLNFRYDVTRTYGEKLFRNNTGFADIIRDTFYNKNFEMRRIYDFKYDLTRSIKVDFNASNYSVVDEPEGKIDTGGERDSVNSNIWGKNYFLGRNKQYQQAGNVSYQLPLNKFPLTDWISLNAKYGFTYNWTAGQFLLNKNTNAFGTDPRTGSTIQNANTKSLNGNFTMTTLYNKVPYLKKINSPKPPPPPKPKTPKPDLPKTPADTAGGKKPAPPVIKPPKGIPDGVRFVGKLIMSVKTVGFTYSTTNGTILPGYRNYSQLLGQDLDQNSPGLGFAFGSQKDLREKAVLNNWITNDTSLNSQYARTYTENFTARSSIEPLTGLKIELTANRTYAKNNSEFFRYNGTKFESQGINQTGNFSISVISWNTAFVKDDKNNYTSSVFETFNTNRKIYSERLAAENPNSSGFNAPDTFGIVYNDGYSGTQQEVLTMAFLSAYTGKSPGKVGNSPFLKTPMPNWRITYDGLSKLPLFKRIFNNVSLSHSYRSTFNINSYQRNPNYVEAETPVVRDVGGNFIPGKEIAQASLTEQFAPLIGVDVTWKNNIQTRIEFKKDRNVSLTYAGVQITETKGNEITFGFGYRIPKFILPFGLGGTRGAAGNSLNLTADFSARKNVTIIRRLLEGINQPTAGLNVYSIKGAADYAMSDRVNIRLFYEQTINTPVISTSYPTSNINAGIELRFSLSQ